MKINSFQDLEVWREGHKLVLAVYKITKEFPGEEKFGLVSQMRRAAVSIPANIAEGFKRRGLSDKIRFYNTAESSLEELKYYFVLSRDLNYLASQDELVALAETVGRLLNGLITSTERRQQL
jgi:four helix bundle protein